MDHVLHQHIVTSWIGFTALPSICLECNLNIIMIMSCWSWGGNWKRRQMKLTILWWGLDSVIGAAMTHPWWWVTLTHLWCRMEGITIAMTLHCYDSTAMTAQGQKPSLAVSDFSKNGSNCRELVTWDTSWSTCGTGALWGNWDASFIRTSWWLQEEWFILLPVCWFPFQ